jgi:hypothetical protein
MKKDEFRNKRNRRFVKELEPENKVEGAETTKSKRKVSLNKATRI